MTTGKLRLPLCHRGWSEQDPSVTVGTIQTVNPGKWLKTEPTGPRRNPSPEGFSGESSQTRKAEPTAVLPQSLQRTRRHPPNSVREASVASLSTRTCDGQSRLATGATTTNTQQQGERRGLCTRERTSSPGGRVTESKSKSISTIHRVNREKGEPTGRPWWLQRLSSVLKSAPSKHI